MSTNDKMRVRIRSICAGIGAAMLTDNLLHAFGLWIIIEVLLDVVDHNGGR